MNFLKIYKILTETFIKEKQKWEKIVCCMVFIYTHVCEQRVALMSYFCNCCLQLEEMSQNHEASLMEMETAHNDTLATLQEEHARTVKSKRPI